jgi:very-short-patch-repair endonuclease
MSPAGGGLRGWNMTSNKSSYSFYNKKLQPLANHLRKNMTKSEACLWKYVLKKRQMKGFQFRRQRPVLDYIADFMCPELNLIIECDGKSHDYADTQERDDIKMKNLEKAGFKVMRFKDEEILNQIESVKKHIEITICEIELQNNLKKT